jgi:crotonobetainyl-CoA:carnitine CoA-transferase CaiB-like acyl-CoA transferase
MVNPAGGVLAGLRVVDLAGSVACLAATLVLAECGADVVLVEPPGGAPLRSKPGFRTWGRSKTSVVLDIADESGRRDLDELLAGADVVVHSLRPSEAAALGLDDAALANRHPDLIVSSILGWPVNHAAAEAPVDDQLTLARLGVLDEQIGARGSSPIYVRFPLGTWPAVWLAVIGIMGRLVSRGRTGIAGPAHTSLAQGALIPMMMHWSRAETPSDALRIGMPKDNMRASLFECGDGRWIHIMPPPPDDSPLMQEVFAEMGPERVAAANAKHAGQAIAPNWVNWGAIIEAFKRRPAEAWLRNMWTNDLPAQEAVDVGVILSDAQAGANRYVVQIDDPVVGRITVPGLPLTVDPPSAVVAPAPAVGSGHADWAPRPPMRSNVTSAPTRYPLEGVRVLDFGNFLAGPLGPMLLADLGATVIKVEATTGDQMRWVEWAFAGCQRGKRAVALDVKSPASRPALEALLRWADVVHHNLRMPAARRLGLDAASVRAVNPEVVFCHVSSYGPAGPRADWPGYDQLFQASCGWEKLAAGEGNPPMWHRFGFMDHLCAMSSIAATLMALYQRDITGRATDSAGSLLGAGVLTNSETYMRADGSLVPVPTLDAQQTMLSAGERIIQLSDGWIAVAATSPRQVERLEKVLAEGPTTVAVVLAALESAGVPAAEVRQEQKGPFFDDPDHLAAGLIASYRHMQWGQMEQPGAMWFFGDQEVRLDLAPPVLGEHTVEVLREVGLSDVEIEAALAAGAVVQHG